MKKLAFLVFQVGGVFLIPSPIPGHLLSGSIGLAMVLAGASGFGFFLGRESKEDAQ